MPVCGRQTDRTLLQLVILSVIRWIAGTRLMHFFSFLLNRKPKKEEHLSEEAAKVISSLPDLTFMHAKVLMFPATLTPSTSCQEKVD